MGHNGYQELANAIIIRAAEDYRILLRLRYKYPDKMEVPCRIKELENDIHTPFFQSLTTLDIDQVFDEIRAEFE